MGGKGCKRLSQLRSSASTIDGKGRMAAPEQPGLDEIFRLCESDHRRLGQCSRSRIVVETCLRGYNAFDTRYLRRCSRELGGNKGRRSRAELSCSSCSSEET